MLTIVEPKSWISKIWGTPKRSSSEYRLIKYHLSVNTDDGELLYNIVTGEMVLLSKEESVAIHNPGITYSDITKKLIEHHFLVPLCYNESNAVLQLKSILKATQSNEPIANYSILPTTKCNARCFYCYESGYKQVSMTKETAEKVIQYIIRNCGFQKVVLHWFGGEPLLGITRISQICEGLKANNIDYESTMISNGFCFSEELVHIAKNIWNLKTVQITLDGTEEVYNSTKNYINTSASPYYRVLDNIRLLLDSQIRVAVRLNLDFHNQNNLFQLIDELAIRFSDNNYLLVYAHELFEEQGFSPVSHTPDEKQLLIQTKDCIEKYISEKGLKKGRMFHKNAQLPSLRQNYCMADTSASVLINPDGSLGKCEHAIFEHLIGHVDSDEQNAQEVKFWSRPSYKVNCRDCLYFPSCAIPTTCETDKCCIPIQLEFKDKQNKLIMKNHYKSFLGGEYVK